MLLISTFTYASEFFTSVLSADFIADGRLILKVLFGSESVFTSLQMLGALSLFLFSFASFAFCICFVRFFLIRNFYDNKNGLEDCSEEAEIVPDRLSTRRFALLSRYLL
ncbi:MAG: hypothetical protein ACI4L9_02650 [Candidatus Coproplasma sp.]